VESQVERIAELEWANYAATLPSAQITPGLDVMLREDMILTSSTLLPAPDTNHACLLRATTNTADELIAELTGYFQSRDLPVAVYVSPACLPRDLYTTLLDRGFRKLEEEEAWLVLENLPEFNIPPLLPGVPVKHVSEDEVIPFAEVFTTAFDLPPNFAPAMAQLLKPSVALPNVDHYLAVSGGQPIGTCSLLRYETFGVLGSAGVVPSQRRGGAATNLVIQALRDAREQGLETIVLQTTAGTSLERLLRISGFARAFTRSCYLLSNDSSGQD
jgi:hypothetical protein